MLWRFVVRNRTAPAPASAFPSLRQTICHRSRHTVWLASMRRVRLAFALFLLLAVLAIGAGTGVLWWYTDFLLRPQHTALPAETPPGAVTFHFTAHDGTHLEGWHFAAATGPGIARRGTLVIIHGSGGHRGVAVNFAAYYNPRGWNVLGLDSRAHGRSGGLCTYGFWEKEDLRQLLDTLPPGQPVVLIGCSMGAAIALQAAAVSPRVSAVLAVDSFSSLRQIAQEQAPAFSPTFAVDLMFALAERRGNFRTDEINPERAAAALHIPTFIICSGADDYIIPAHSHRIYAALPGPKSFLEVPGARHTEAFGLAWKEMDAWINEQ